MCFKFQANSFKIQTKGLGPTFLCYRQVKLKASFHQGCERYQVEPQAVGGGEGNGESQHLPRLQQHHQEPHRHGYQRWEPTYLLPLRFCT